MEAHIARVSCKMCIVDAPGMRAPGGSFTLLCLRTQACEGSLLSTPLYALLLSSLQFPSVPFPLPGFTLKGDVALSAPL